MCGWPWGLTGSQAASTRPICCLPIFEELFGNSTPRNLHSAGQRNPQELRLPSAALFIQIVLEEVVLEMPHKPLPDDWKKLLEDCDFDLARQELKSFLDFVNRDAESRRETAIYGTEFVVGWQRFAQDPSFQTAVAMIDGAPEYGPMVFEYFVACRPLGRFAFYRRARSEPFV